MIFKDMVAIAQRAELRFGLIRRKMKSKRTIKELDLDSDSNEDSEKESS